MKDVDTVNVMKPSALARVFGILRRLGALVLAGCLLVAALPSGSARADEVAPDLEGADLRVHAQSVLRKLVSALAKNDQRRLAGIYVAFDPTMSDPLAQVACDDDGDYVIVLSDAILRSIAHVARAASQDGATGARKLDEYAAFVSRTQIAGRRIVPPPPGFFEADEPVVAYEDRFGGALAFVLARELAHFRAGDLVCPHPTATKESGDDVWSIAEQRHAARIALSVYPGQQVDRDAEATERLLGSGYTEKGAIALLRFFGALGRFDPSYTVHHPGSSVRALTVGRVVAASPY